MRTLTAFTMAEILLSLTIIGVVAAITLPSLTGNINERTWNTQRKALYARFSQAIALMPALNGYGTLTEETDSAGSISITDTAAETFVTSGLAKVLKINNICDYEHLADCGIANKITTLEAKNTLNLDEINTLVDFNSAFSYTANNKFTTPNTKAAAFETNNGESIIVYYNPRCTGYVQETGSHYVQNKICANFVYDLNGTKGPNTVGKDIGFITALYSTDSVVVAPIPATQNAGTSGYGYQSQGKGPGASCKKQNSDYRAPNTEELISLFCNNELVNMTLKYNTVGTGYFWSITPSQLDDKEALWIQHITTGLRMPAQKGTAEPVRCVLR